MEDQLYDFLREHQEEIRFVRLETNTDIAKVSVVGAADHLKSPV